MLQHNVGGGEEGLQAGGLKHAEEKGPKQAVGVAVGKAAEVWGVAVQRCPQQFARAGHVFGIGFLVPHPQIVFFSITQKRILCHKTGVFIGHQGPKVGRAGFGPPRGALGRGGFCEDDLHNDPALGAQHVFEFIKQMIPVVWGDGFKQMIHHNKIVAALQGCFIENVGRDPFVKTTHAHILLQGLFLHMPMG